MIHTLTSGLLVFTLAAVPAKAPGLVLSAPGRPAPTIVIAGDAPESVKFAAHEFQEHIRRGTGTTLDILVDRKPDTGAVVYLGESQFTRKLGITTDALPPEGFRWRTGPNWLVIIGRDYAGKPIHGLRNPWNLPEVWNAQLKIGAFGETGTLNGVYRFLETFCGVRWFMPGPLGTVVPHRDTLQIPVLNAVHGPDFSYRYPWFCDFTVSPDDALWFKRVGFGGACPVQAIDSFRMFLKYKDQHPEYFALIDGKRDTGKLSCITGGGNLCLSNEGLLKQMAADIGTYFDKNPEARFFPVAPNDGMTRICGCPRCAPLDEKEKGPHGRFSNYVWRFVNRLAVEVAKAHPGRFIGTIAYEGYLDPPDRIGHLQPNVAVMLCQNRGTFGDPTKEKAASRRIQGWRAKTNHLYLWEYYRDNLPPFPWAPVAYPHLIADDLRRLNGVSDGEFIESESWQGGLPHRMHHPAMQHLNLYVTAKCLWNADTDVDALLDNYFHSFYGPAAIPMKAFWTEAEEVHRTGAGKSIVSRFSPQVLTRLGGSLARTAAAVSADGVYRQRVELIQTEFGKLEAALANPLVKSPPGMTCYGLPGPVRVDGVLDEPAWARVRPRGFVTRNGGEARFKSLVYAGHDDTRLVLGILNVEPKTAALVTNARREDPGAGAGIWSDDCVEIFISPDPGNRKQCYQFIVNAAGVVWDAAYGLPKPGPGLFGCEPAWNCAGLTAAVERGRTRWTVEVAIPFSSIGLPHRNAGQRLAVNFYRCRNCGEPPVYSAWSPPLTAAHFTPERFGELRLTDARPPAESATRRVPQSVNDYGSGAASGPGWYTPGGVLSGKPFVGNPNTLLRRDRMVVKFDISPLALRYGETGVQHAVLRMMPLYFAGPEDVRIVELSHFRYTMAAFSWKDIISENVEVVGQTTVPRATATKVGVAFNVTKAVNTDLATGRLCSAFRLRDIGSEKGNPDMKPDGLTFPPFDSGKVYLDIRPK